VGIWTGLGWRRIGTGGGRSGRFTVLNRRMLRITSSFVACLPFFHIT